MKYYKILQEDENHLGFQYHDGRIDNPNPILHDGICLTGGIRFYPANTVLEFAWIGPWIREVTVPEDVEIVKDVGYKYEVHRASSVILGPRRRWADMDVFLDLVEHGADIHASGDDRLLLLAVTEGRLDLVKYLVEHGMDIHAIDDYTLRWAAVNNRLSVVRFLLEQGSDIHAWDDGALWWAARRGHTDVVKYLVEYGANVHALNDAALRYAAEYGHFDTVKYLVEQGSDIHALNNYAFYWATRYKYQDIVNYLNEQVAKK